MSVLSLVDGIFTNDLKKIDSMIEKVEQQAAEIRKRIKNNEYRVKKDMHKLKVEVDNILDVDTKILLLADSLGMFFDEIGYSVRQSSDLSYDYIANLMMEINIELVDLLRCVHQIEDKFEQ